MANATKQHKSSTSNLKKRAFESNITPNRQDNFKKPCLMDMSVNLFHDTLPFLDDTQALINNSCERNSEVTEADSFTQLCNDTQVLRKIDEDVEAIVGTIQEHEMHNTIIMNDEEFITEELIKLKHDIESRGKNSEDISENLEKEVNDIFRSSQFKRDVDVLFDKVESSICENGENAVITSTPARSSLAGKSSITWGNESLLTEAVLQMSAQDEVRFGDILKKALLENANKVVSPSKLVNATLPNFEPTFRSMGNFYGLPGKVKELLKMYRGIDTLYEWQDECLNLPAISIRKNLVYALPTSGGKTLVAEILILREILCRKRNALFVLPYVAIVQEKVWSLSPFAVALNFLVEEFAGGKGTYPPRKRRRKNSVYVATMEKALGLINSLIDTGRLDEIGLVVVDELHLVGESGRGSVLEELLTKLTLIGEHVHIVGMSATIGNLTEICEFLDADVYTRNFRPVELVEYVKCGDQLARIDWKAKSDSELLVDVKKKDFSYSEKMAKIDPDRLGGLVMEVVPLDSCLVFCSSKKSCENVVWLLCRVVPAKLKEYKKEAKKTLKDDLKNETGDLCSILKTSIDFGIAYHHSGLTSGERKLIEDSFRDGILSVICCTSTLAAGVNLPARRVILRQPYVGRSFINLSRYKQMVGRAGRAGLGKLGESILICTELDLPKVRGLLSSPMDQALSSMHEDGAKGLRQLLLSCISLNIANTRAQLHRMMKKTLLFVQQAKLEVRVNKLADKALAELFKLGALEADAGTTSSEDASYQSTDITLRMNCSDSNTSLGESFSSESQSENQKPKLKVTIHNNSKLIISKLGSAAIKGGLELKRAHLLYEDLLQAQASLVLLNCLHLLYLVTPYDIAEQITLVKSRYYNLYTQLNKSELQTAKVLGLNESCAVRLLNNAPIKHVPERVLKRFYVTLILYDLWNEKSIFQVSEKYDVPRGLVQNLMSSAASFASNVVNFCSELKEFWSFAYLLKGMSERLQHCCIKELIPLMELPSVKQCRAKQLYDAGFKNLAVIAKANPNQLVDTVEHMTVRLANQLIAAAKLLLLERVENLRDEAEDVLDGVEQPKLMNYSIIR